MQSLYANERLFISCKVALSILYSKFTAQCDMETRSFFYDYNQVRVCTKLYVKEFFSFFFQNSDDIKSLYAVCVIMSADFNIWLDI